ncbi:MAG: chemotaxis protein CheA [Colwellia sp.]|nr:chemotaxis protein CheA [Colwellia sp.]
MNTVSDEHQEGLEIFAQEAEELLLQAEQALLVLDEDFHDEDAINELFRAFHTVKGGAGLFGLNNIVDFTHHAESLLSLIRDEVCVLDESLVSLFLQTRDFLEKLIDFELNQSGELSEEFQQENSSLVTQLQKYLPSTKDTSADDSKETDDGESTEGIAQWHISLRFGIDSLRNGMDPNSFISYLAKLGKVEHIVLIDEAIPEWTEFDPENCYLGFEINLLALTSKQEIEDVFEFVLDDCKIEILPPGTLAEQYIKLINELPEDDLRLGEILVACGALTKREVDAALSPQELSIDNAIGQDKPTPIPQIGEIIIQDNLTTKPVVEAALKKQQRTKSNKAATESIRVNAEKLESLINLVGELVIGNANVNIHAKRIADLALFDAQENMSRLVAEVRDTVLGLRMVQIGETFNRYKRVVREVSKTLNKSIRLEISGAETELDKTLIDKISDPLLHLVRNALDHGIESKEDRLKAGKDETGLLSLEAFHDSGTIVIQIKDDGAGLNKDKILAKAIDKGIIDTEHELTDHQIHMLIFEAGFSTAEQVTNLSGRGVGMDVVRRNIEALRGEADVDSVEGHGCTFSIRLPLTLAIIDGFHVRVGDSHYILPLDMVEECIELTDSQAKAHQHHDYLNLRGEILPFMHIGEIFAIDNHNENCRANIVVVKSGNKKAGLIVDELLGEHQTVIKPLGQVFRNLKGLSGSTILGSGEVALIIDVPNLLQQIVSKFQQASNPKNLAKA